MSLKKSLEMLNFKNISPNADFYSKLDLLLTRLDILNKNLLYCTHMEDKILKLLKTITVDNNTQKQVDDFYEDPHTGLREETSPQTESDEHFEDKPDDIKWSSSQ